MPLPQISNAARLLQDDQSSERFSGSARSKNMSIAGTWLFTTLNIYLYVYIYICIQQDSYIHISIGITVRNQHTMVSGRHLALSVRWPVTDCEGHPSTANLKLFKACVAWPVAPVAFGNPKGQAVSCYTWFVAFKMSVPTLATTAKRMTLRWGLFMYKISVKNHWDQYPCDNLTKLLSIIYI